MKRRPCLPLLLVTALLLTAGTAHAAPAPAKPKPESATALALKQVASRYALTKEHITTLLDQRLHPAPLPTTLPNPFYRVPETPVGDTAATGPADVAAAPAAADISDADTLANYAASIKISGLVVLNGQPRLTINSSLCKVGDVIPAGTKDRPVYIEVLGITADELTLGLNDAKQTIRVRK